VPWFRLLGLEYKNFSISRKLPHLAVGKGWKCLWFIISLSNCLGTNKYSVPAFQHSKKNSTISSKQEGGKLRERLPF